MGQSTPSRILGRRLNLVKQKVVAQFCVAALHGHVKEDPGRTLDSGVCGRARRMPQVVQGMHGLLLSLVIRGSSKVFFPSTVYQD